MTLSVHKITISHHRRHHHHYHGKKRNHYNCHHHTIIHSITIIVISTASRLQTNAAVPSYSVQPHSTSDPHISARHLFSFLSSIGTYNKLAFIRILARVCADFFIGINNKAINHHCLSVCLCLYDCL